MPPSTQAHPPAIRLTNSLTRPYDKTGGQIQHLADSDPTGVAITRMYILMATRAVDTAQGYLSDSAILEIIQYNMMEAFMAGDFIAMIFHMWAFRRLLGKSTCLPVRTINSG